MKALDWAYDKAIEGIPGILESAAELAEGYANQSGSLEEKAHRLVKWQVAKAGTTGFLTGLGGLVTMPVMVPAGFGSVLLIQTRMIAGIAHMAAYDVRSDQVRTLAYVCMCGNAGKNVLKNAGIRLGTRLTQQAVQQISGRALIEINQKVGLRLLTKFGEKGIINFGKVIPIVGGVIGGTFDSVGTHSVGKVTIKVFLGDGSSGPLAEAAA